MIGWDTNRIFEEKSWQNFDFMTENFIYGDC